MNINLLFPFLAIRCSSKFMNHFPHALVVCNAVLCCFEVCVLSSTIQVMKDRNVVEQLVKRAERAGFKAIVIIVDTPRLGRREADIKNR